MGHRVEHGLRRVPHSQRPQVLVADHRFDSRSRGPLPVLLSTSVLHPVEKGPQKGRKNL